MPKVDTDYKITQCLIDRLMETEPLTEDVAHALVRAASALMPTLP